MEIKFDKIADAAYIRFRKGKVAYTEELDDGYAVDFNRLGKVIGVEVLYASAKIASEPGLKIPERVFRLAQ